jgi:hypothetical protein
MKEVSCFALSTSRRTAPACSTESFPGSAAILAYDQEGQQLLAATHTFPRLHQPAGNVLEGVLPARRGIAPEKADVSESLATSLPISTNFAETSTCGSDFSSRSKSRAKSHSLVHSVFR